MEEEFTKPDAWTVVQIIRGEPHGAVGPFDSKEEAEGWIQQHRELTPHTEMAAFFAVDTVRPR